VQARAIRTTATLTERLRALEAGGQQAHR
jgi:hypothetical protein